VINIEGKGKCIHLPEQQPLNAHGNMEIVRHASLISALDGMACQFLSPVKFILMGPSVLQIRNRVVPEPFGSRGGETDSSRVGIENRAV
jgi:hypothetical protein